MIPGNDTGTRLVSVLAISFRPQWFSAAGNDTGGNDTGTRLVSVLSRTPAGRWFCCEVYRSPGFAVCQHAAGGRVAEAIADLLAVKRRIG
jgi:hypothetical protein